jgi:hypothetical protein
VRATSPNELRAQLLASAVFEAFANVAPRPVTREYAQQPWVQFQTDRRRSPSGAWSPASFVWHEAPVRVLHGAAVAATTEEPCTTPLILDEEVKLRWGSYRLARGVLGDRLHVDNGKIAVGLPVGAFHGGCVVEERRLWLSWSTPSSPPELFTVTLRDGRVRALRSEARPSLGGLADIQLEELSLATDSPPGRRVEALGMRRKDQQKQVDARSSPLVWVTSEQAESVGPGDRQLAPLAAYRPVARALAEAGAHVLLTSAARREDGNGVAIAAVRALAAREGRALWVVRSVKSGERPAIEASGDLFFSDEADRVVALRELLLSLDRAKHAPVRPPGSSGSPDGAEPKRD